MITDAASSLVCFHPGTRDLLSLLLTQQLQNKTQLVRHFPARLICKGPFGFKKGIPKAFLA